MRNALGLKALQWAGPTPWTNVYGAARTLLALSTALTLALNETGTLFRPAATIPSAPYCEGAAGAGLFCLAPDGSLDLMRWLAVGVLLVVASGWRPRWTAPAHWYVTFSFASSAIVVDGGEHVSQVLTLLILPLALTDPRKWHWSRPPALDGVTPSHLVARSAWLVARVQVAWIYLQASVAKLAVPEWADGTALYYWFTDPSFGAPGWLQGPLMALLDPPVALVLATWSVMALELALAAGLVVEKRHWGPLLVLGIGLHLGIAVIHGLISFAVIMFAALILFLRPADKPFDLRLPSVVLGRVARRVPALARTAE